ncbi:MAG: cache domain-containing protein [Vulcanimicrobiota bacterium]
MLRSRLFIRIFSGIIIQLIVFASAVYLVLDPLIINTVYELEEESARSILETCNSLVEGIYSNYEREKEDTRDDKKRELKNYVIMTAALAEQTWREAKSGVVKEDRARKRLLREMRALRFGPDHYVWVCDYNSRILSHPDHRIQGKDFSKIRDAKGIIFVPDMVKAARRDGEAYTYFWWRPPGDFKPILKMCYVRHVPEWKWVMVAGLCSDDEDEELEVIRERLSTALEKVFQKIKIGRTGYLMVYDSNYVMHYSPSKDLEGKNMGGLKDSITGKPALQRLIESIQTPHHERIYKLVYPRAGQRYESELIGWTRYQEGFDWYITLSVSTEELNRSSRQLQVIIISISALFLGLALYFGYLFAKSLTNPIMRLSKAANEVKEGNLTARSEIRRDDELGVLSKNFDTMVEQLRLRSDELNAAIRDLHEANEKLTELDRMKSSFLSTVSHELRTPLTSVLGFAKITLHKLESVLFPLVHSDDRKVLKTINQVRENLEIISTEGVRLTDLVNDVLDLAKMEAGRIDWKMESISLLEVIEKATLATSSLFLEGGVVLIRELPPELPLVTGDRNRLIQVVINIISNAVKFTEQGSITIRAGVVTLAEAGIPGNAGRGVAWKPEGFQNKDRASEEFVKVSVVDTGIGIALSDQDKVFDQFRQVGDTLTGRPQGTGLGLSICAHIIEYHSGHIWVESEPGKGSSFSFIIPVLQSSAPESEEKGDKE